MSIELPTRPKSSATPSKSFAVQNPGAAGAMVTITENVPQLVVVLNDCIGTSRRNLRRTPDMFLNATGRRNVPTLRCTLPDAAVLETCIGPLSLNNDIPSLNRRARL
jgi:hypothetical protein